MQAVRYDEKAVIKTNKCVVIVSKVENYGALLIGLQLALWIYANNVLIAKLPKFHIMIKIYVCLSK